MPGRGILLLRHPLPVGSRVGFASKPDNESKKALPEKWKEQSMWE